MPVGGAVPSSINTWPLIKIGCGMLGLCCGVVVVGLGMPGFLVVVVPVVLVVVDPAPLVPVVVPAPPLACPKAGCSANTLPTSNVLTRTVVLGDMRPP